MAEKKKMWFFNAIWEVTKETFSFYQESKILTLLYYYLISLQEK